MSTDPGEPAVAPGANSGFAQTRWSVVLLAARTDTVRAEAALGQLCRAYWYPLYAFVRRSGHSAEDAQDLTQEFFSRLLEKNWLAEADPARGRFRSFLLTALKHFLANEWDRSQRLKRGGGQQFVALDAATAEERYALEPRDPATPETLYDRRWALTLLTRAQDRLRAENKAGGEGERYELLEPTLVGERTSLPYAELAVKFGVEETTVKSWVLRMRRRFRLLLREEAGETTGNAEDVDAELAHLFSILAG
jgi:RNA polymerase sigma-70 factor (ECF subfamily)